MTVLRPILGSVLSLLFVFNTSALAGKFIDNKDATVLDSQTNLMWQQSDDGTERIWDEAVKYCQDLELAGYSDWMLPKIFMLEGLIDPGQSPTIDPIFSVKPSYYWSSSESRTSVKSAKYVNFFYGNTYTYSKNNTYYALCVRDASADAATPLTADFKFSKGSKILSVDFMAKISGGSEPYFHEWDFGDGDTSSLSDPAHDFPGEGAYTIMLTVSDNDGSIAVSSQQIILPLPETASEPAAVEEPAESENVAATADIAESPVAKEAASDAVSNVADDAVTAVEEKADTEEVMAQETEPEPAAMDSEMPEELTEETLPAVAAIPNEVDILKTASEEQQLETAQEETGATSDVSALQEKDGTGEESVVREAAQGLDVAETEGETDLAVFDAASEAVEQINTEKTSQDVLADAVSQVNESSEQDAADEVTDQAVASVDVKASDDSVINEQSVEPESEVMSENAAPAAEMPAEPALAEPAVDREPQPVGAEETKVAAETVSETTESQEKVVAAAESVADGQMKEDAVTDQVEAAEMEVSADKPLSTELPSEPEAEQTSAAEVGQVGERSVLKIFATAQATENPADISGYHILAYAFANAVSGDADLNKDNKVTAYELKGYLNIAMDTLSEGRQKPVISLDGDSFGLCSENHDTYAIVVGANQYHQGADSWPHAVESAELVRKSIEDTCRKVQTVSLFAEHANRPGVLQALMQVKKQIQPDDSLVFYFTGKSEMGPDGRLLFSLYDTVPEMSFLTGLYYADVLNFISSMNTKHITLLLETQAQ